MSSPSRGKGVSVRARSPTSTPLSCLKRRWRRGLLHGSVAACASLGALAVAVAPALAARGHVRSTLPAFGGVCLSTPCEGALEEPNGIAVNEETGDVYVADRGGNRIVRYSAEGVYESEFNGSSTLGEGISAGSGGGEDKEPTGEFQEPEDVAIDNACAQHQPEALTGTACDEDHRPNDQKQKPQTRILRKLQRHRG